ncbi:hypothetical protein DSL72_007173 [Monilinia vaccinii-corymbosi]|uniref:Uncharacterized protein n=1 Tax=Monilinia vaccinii-corymbosi TaxID=61207 RepID=A0A8A3PM73_9HELO|nr:hypothetical protein DSL72_007173 [Monilinia vaccinii-corymbosi]
MADQAPQPKSRPTSMLFQKPASPVDRTTLKSALKKSSSMKSPPTSTSQPSPRKPLPRPTRPISISIPTPLAHFQTPTWLLNFWASKVGLVILEIWHKWIVRHQTKLLIAVLVYSIFIYLIAEEHEMASEHNLTHLSQVLKIAGNFSNTVDDGYLFEQIPLRLQSARADLQEFSDAQIIMDDDPLAQPMDNLLAGLESVGLDWESLGASRDRAITSVKEQVQLSRSLFLQEYEKLVALEEAGKAPWWRRQRRKMLLENPHEAHFAPHTFENITGDIELLILTWRAHTIPDLRYRLTSSKGGRTGGLPGQVREVQEAWPRKTMEFQEALVGWVEDARGRAVRTLDAADLEYGRLLFAMRLLDKEGGYDLRGGFGWWHLETLVGEFDRTIQRLEDAEEKVRERRGTGVDWENWRIS